MVIRRLVGAQVSRRWDMSRLGKGVDTAYWLTALGVAPVGATSIRFGIIAIDTWQKRPSRYDAVIEAKARNAERGRIARWALGEEPGAGYGRHGEPMLSSPRLSANDSSAVKTIGLSQSGRLLMAACSVATAIEGQRCWSNPILDSVTIRINLEDEIRQIASSARSIREGEKALGDKPSGQLSKNDEVMSIYESRRDALDGRMGLLLERVQTLKRYLDNLKNLDAEFDRLEWIREKSADDGRDITIATEQERQQLTDAAERADDMAGVGEAVMQSLIDDAHRIFKMNENH